MENRIFNFSAGPATLPLEVLKQAQSELVNYQNAGMSLMEMSHRSKEFDAVIKQAKDRFIRILQIPDTHDVLFLQGGASLQFSMVPLNLMQSGQSADVINTGAWTKKAIKEIQKVGDCRIIATSQESNFNHIPQVSADQFDANAAFAYLTSNNTIFGTQFQSFPDTGDVPLVADMSSDILSRPLDISKFGIIFAGAQKNLGPAGITVVIIRKDLAERASEDLPTMLQYRTYLKSGSLYNTPPTFAIYIVNLVLKWIEDRGGLTAIEKANQEKASLLYSEIDSNPFYYTPTQEGSRSPMNVVFRITGDKEELEAKFVAEATEKELSGLKGHRSVGGLRASIYNAHPIEGCQALVEFMQEFAKRNR